VPPPGPDRVLVLVEIALAVVTFVALCRIDAPYGRYSRARWGPTLPSRLAWLLMESPAPLLFAAVYVAGPHRGEAVPLALAALWEVHYVYRSFVYPVLLRPGARVPLAVMLLAVAFNVLNGWVNARWVADFGRYPGRWFVDPRFIVGVALFASGLALHAVSDRGLRRLRAAGSGGYQVPRGGAFEWVSCPNYLGEIVEWTGWALATWSLAGLAFALYTAANLAPRALAHHGWYRRRFPDYPPRRRALVPFVL
jgi:protein-S-isoprenylcysteine O-methyltransferase Ste14